MIEESLKQALVALEELNKVSIGKNAISLPAEIDTAMDVIRKTLADFDTHTMYREGYVNGYAFGEAAAKQKAIQEEALSNVQRIGQEIEQDWSTQAAALESLREHMARIKELEAQLEQMKADKPVAWMDSSGHPKHLRHIQNSEERRLYGELQPLYLHSQTKREPVGRFAKFTDGIWREVTDGSPGQPLYTHPQPVTTCSGCGESSTEDGFLATYCLKCCVVANGKREWVELTSDEIEKTPPMHSNGGYEAYARAIEAKLKEKNT